MGWLATKYLITAAIVVAVSEVAKRSDRLGALIASLPLVTLLAMVWLYVEDQPQQKIADHAFYTFWYVLPTGIAKDLNKMRAKSGIKLLVPTTGEVPCTGGLPR